MSEEDDWFERALRDLDEESDRSADTEGDETADGEGDETADGEGDDAPEPAAGGERPAADEDDPFGGVRDGPGGTEPDDAGDESDPFGGGSFGDADPFGGEDAGSGAPGEDPGGGFGETDFGADPGEGGPGDPEPPATDEGAGAPFGGADDEGGEDPFGGYRGDTSAESDDFGFGDFDGGGDGAGGGGTETEFDVDPDEFESAIDRTDIGIDGLDDMILGGVPSRSLLSVIGGAGTGKTTFALQFLNEALESDEKGVYITLEQTRESIFSTAEEKGWSFREAADEDRLAVVAIDPIEMANSLASIRNDLTRLIAEFDADRLVLDSVSLLEMMYDHPAKRRSEVFGFTRSLKDAGVTTLLTSEASQETSYASRHGIVEYLTDAVFVLQYVRGSDFRETRLAVEIQKIRDANHSRETKPYEITDTGISVYGQANIF
ncbi:KaiC domain-containing protein [Halorubrum yunnanense]|uniref:KaiC domain-containing protein n=1 Tax=Halorubrum yunnanense TaxID=1526162 RepID=A0ABD5YJ67_9EURY|nr:KaiC domain-containing protein [Halorubrum yunnanense]